MEKLNFIDTYWSQLNQIIQEMEDQLPILPTTKTKPGGKYLSTINYSQMNDWSVSRVNTKLKALVDKIKHMILKGDAPNVKPMLEAICKGQVKKLKQPGYGSFGTGHFRWNYKAYLLNEEEIERVKVYFNL